MNTAKHSKDWNSQSSPKKPFIYWIRQNAPLLLTILLGTLWGTYLDLYFTGKSVYSFPIRPMPSIFSVNIAFTLVGLPLLTGIFLYVCTKIITHQKVGIILLISLVLSIFEKQAETFGFFAHHESWKHTYSFFGYVVYLIVIDFIYRSLK